MAAEKEGDVTGRAPVDWGAGARGNPGPSAAKAPPVGRETEPGPRGARGPTGRAAGRGAADVLISAVLALVFGGAGAWAYERFLARPGLEAPAEASTSQSGDAAATKALARLDDRIKNLSDQHKQLESRVESIPK